MFGISMPKNFRDGKRVAVYSQGTTLYKATQNLGTVTKTVSGGQSTKFKACLSGSTYLFMPSWSYSGGVHTFSVYRENVKDGTGTWFTFSFPNSTYTTCVGAFMYSGKLVYILRSGTTLYFGNTAGGEVNGVYQTFFGTSTTAWSWTSKTLSLAGLPTGATLVDIAVRRVFTTGEMSTDIMAVLFSSGNIALIKLNNGFTASGSLTLGTYTNDLQLQTYDRDDGYVNVFVMGNDGVASRGYVLGISGDSGNTAETQGPAWNGVERQVDFTEVVHTSIYFDKKVYFQTASGAVKSADLRTAPGSGTIYTLTTEDAPTGWFLASNRSSFRTSPTRITF